MQERQCRESLDCPESADFMPLWQLEKVMQAELGSDWREKFQEFQNEPFAAASIGEYCAAKLCLGVARDI